MNKTLFRAEKFKQAYFYELVNGDFFVHQGKLFIKVNGCGLCISEPINEYNIIDCIPLDLVVTKAISFSVARL